MKYHLVRMNLARFLTVQLQECSRNRVTNFQFKKKNVTFQRI